LVFFFFLSRSAGIVTYTGNFMLALVNALLDGAGIIEFLEGTFVIDPGSAFLFQLDLTLRSASGNRNRTTIILARPLDSGVYLNSRFAFVNITVQGFFSSRSLFRFMFFFSLDLLREMYLSVGGTALVIIKDGRLDISNCEITTNLSITTAGVIQAERSVVNIVSSTISNIKGRSLPVQTVDRNIIGNGAGALKFDNCQLSIIDCSIRSNILETSAGISLLNGALMLVLGGNFTILDTVFDSNVVESDATVIYGAGLTVQSGLVGLMDNVTFTSNRITSTQASTANPAKKAFGPAFYINCQMITMTSITSHSNTFSFVPSPSGNGGSKSIFSPLFKCLTAYFFFFFSFHSHCVVLL
jgi:hypothetical protein